MAYAGLPAPLQAIHLVVGSLLIGSVMLVYLMATRLPLEQPPNQAYSTPMSASTSSVMN
jgi:cytochrome c oxidase assembly protein subunit 15